VETQVRFVGAGLVPARATLDRRSGRDTYLPRNIRDEPFSDTLKKFRP
jgi:hypothetical protein